ncbi:enoyl-CoA hydratase/isomerase family protein [Bradyrhizobium sp. 153]|uniref:enoyl-CoA hydratase/isomerase family protein n=1 Tax=Bradyrhizobium sp. 153 TaxID=2782627 RepID=UPI001FF7B582|nr:enoyl-CoA hydratase/isomerase family protein [Bradyrhizobium sp. 153]MCK1663529.1 enoyl-CoA hydratase/isomerase family protein [Bradyrhizobium sp. 153]
MLLNRPHSYNAWSEAPRDQFTRKLHSADSDPVVDAVIITWTGNDAFCAGQDLYERQESSGGGYIDSYSQRISAGYEALKGLGKPLIGALNGVAAGSGFQLTHFCDYVIAHPSVRVGQTEVSVAIPSIFGTWLMGERIGSRACQLALQGRLMDAEEATQLGFINEWSSLKRSMLHWKPPAVLPSNRRARSESRKRPNASLTRSATQIRLKMPLMTRTRRFPKGNAQLWSAGAVKSGYVRHLRSNKWPQRLST